MMFFREYEQHGRFGPSRKHANSLALLLVLTGAVGCHQEVKKRYPIPQAEVISVDLPHKLIVIKHGEIPGLMPAMTMSYLIANQKEAEGLGPGDKISAELVVSENVAHLEKIVLIEKAKLTQPNAAPRAPVSP